MRASAVVVTSGGISGNHDLVRRTWPQRLGEPPRTMVSGVPAHVDGPMLGISEAAGARVINPDRMWHYVEGVRNWDPIWENHGIRILPGPSALWLAATGRWLPAPCFPGFDTLGTLRHLRTTGHDYSWFVLPRRSSRRSSRSRAPSRIPTSPARTSGCCSRGCGAARRGRSRRSSGTARTSSSPTPSPSPFAGMNRVGDEGVTVDEAELRRLVEARDREIANQYSKDAQVTALRGARACRGDKLVRVASPQRLLDPKAGPLIAVRLNILTRRGSAGSRPTCPLGA